MSIKDKLYDYIVRKNENVRYEYERYVMEHTIEHYENRRKHWKILWKLNWHYRVKKKNEPMLYFDVIETKKTSQKTKDKKSKKSSLKLNDSVKLSVNNVKKNVSKIKNSKEQTGNSKSNISEKLPYLDGAESRLFPRKSPHYLCKSLMQYDIISFDIFDTLVFRPFGDPTDLFIILGEQLHVYNFKEIRIRAEAMAREQHMALFGNTEIDIYDIYNIIEKMTGISKEEGVKKEVELELEFIRVNPYCKRLFDLLIDQGKRIIICSDMYLPKQYIKQILDKCGYSEVEEIYVSCEFTFNKRTAGMYKMLKSKYKDCSIVHMGDNYAVDVKVAKECGLDTIFSKNVNVAGMQYRAVEMSPLIGSAYAGIVNMHLHNGLYSYSPLYEYGYIYGGIYILGFCSWIYRHAIKNKIDKILFLSRDGDILKKVFDYLYPEVKSEYVYWSRIAGQKYAFEYDFNDFITKMIIHKVNNPTNHDTIGDLLDILSLDEFKEKLTEYRLMEEEELTLQNKECLINFFVENKSEILKSILKEREILEKWFDYYLEDSRKISVVDVGWIGSGPLGIKYLINKVWKKDIEIHCLLAANRHYNDEANAISIVNEEIESYLFNSNFNVDIFKSHSTTNQNTNNLYFEQFTQAQIPSFEGVNKDGEFVFDLPEIENYAMIEEIHTGIFDFVKDYFEIFRNYDYMFNISGYDAYAPFKLIIKNLKYIKNYLGDMSYSRTVGSNKREQNMETLKEIMNNAKL